METYFKLVDLVDQVIATHFESFAELLDEANKHTGIQKIYFIHVIVIFGLVLIAVNYFTHFVQLFVTCYYPARKTLLALKDKDAAECQHWLNFWAVFGLIQLVFGLVDSILGFLPFRSLTKTLIIMWCYFPGENNGTKIISAQFLQPMAEMIKQNPLDRLSESLESLSEKLRKRKNRKTAKATNKSNGESALVKEATIARKNSQDQAEKTQENAADS